MILLILFLVWDLINTLSRIFLRNNSIDVQIFSNFNLLIFLYIMTLLLTIFNISSIYSILKKKKWGYYVLISFLAISIFMSLLTTYLSTLNLDLLKEATIISREARGLSTNGLDLVINPALFWVITTLISIFYLFLIYYIHKNKKYFNK